MCQRSQLFLFRWEAFSSSRTELFPFLTRQQFRGIDDLHRLVEWSEYRQHPVCGDTNRVGASSW